MFRGCFRRPDNLSLALPVTAAMPNMSVDKCVDFCTEKVSAESCSQRWDSGRAEGAEHTEKPQSGWKRSQMGIWDTGEDYGAACDFPECRAESAPQSAY